MHITPQEFYFFTPIELYYAFKEYAEIEDGKIKVQYEAMRIQTFYLMNIQLDKKHRIRSVEKLMPFPWDKQRDKVAVKTQTPEEMKHVMMAWARKLNKTNTKKSNE